MMSKAIVLAVCQFLAHTELVSEPRAAAPEYHHATIDYGYDADCVYYDTETGQDRPCNEWEHDMMEDEDEEVNWDREVSGDGEMRFDHETGRWTWEGPLYEMEDLRYVVDESEEEPEEDTSLYFSGEEEDTTAWMTEPQETWVELESQFRYFSSSVKAVDEEEDEAEEEQVTTFKVKRKKENKMDDIKNQFDRLLKKGYLKNSPVLDDLMNGKFDYLLNGSAKEDRMKDFCGGALSEVYYNCLEWNNVDENESDYTEFKTPLPFFYYQSSESPECGAEKPSNKPAPWSLSRVMKPIAAPRNKPAYHVSEIADQTEGQSTRVLFQHGGKTYDVVIVSDIVVRDFDREEEDEEEWYDYDDENGEYNYGY